jgi:2-succinyl-6-hydroxy-2,4-cyclohexadiene-1-carboxylate synthase
MTLPFGYLCGEHDDKFSTLARQSALPYTLVADAGHNAHRANPSAFADQLRSLLAPFG